MIGHDEDNKSSSLTSQPPSEQGTSLASRPLPDELTGEAQDDDDDLLDLLTEEDEDLLDQLGTRPVTQEPSQHKTPTTHSDTLAADSVDFAPLSNPLYHVLEASAGGHERDNTERLYHVLEPNEERGRGSEERRRGSDYQRFNFTSNQAYMRAEDLPCRQEEEPRYVTHDNIMNSKYLSGEPVYANDDQEKSGKFYDVPPTRPNGGMSEGKSPPKPDSSLYKRFDDVNEKSHIYECLDALESTDGGLLSRPPEPEVVFKNLPPLVCAAHFGDESSLTKLSDTASSVIKEAIKIIQNILSELWALYRCS